MCGYLTFHNLVSFILKLSLFPIPSLERESGSLGKREFVACLEIKRAVIRIGLYDPSLLAFVHKTLSRLPLSVTFCLASACVCVRACWAIN